MISFANLPGRHGRRCHRPCTWPPTPVSESQFFELALTVAARTAGDARSPTFPSMTMTSALRCSQKALRYPRTGQEGGQGPVAGGLVSLVACRRTPFPATVRLLGCDP